MGNQLEPKDNAIKNLTNEVRTLASKIDRLIDLQAQTKYKDLGLINKEIREKLTKLKQ